MNFTGGVRLRFMTRFLGDAVVRDDFEGVSSVELVSCFEVGKDSLSKDIFVVFLGDFVEIKRVGIILR